MANKKTVEAIVVEQAEAPSEDVLEPVQVAVEPEAAAEEVVVSDPVQAPERPAAVRAGAGDSYTTIAGRFVSDPQEIRDFAKKIQQANNYAPVSYGMKVMIP